MNTAALLSSPAANACGLLVVRIRHASEERLPLLHVRAASHAGRRSGEGGCPQSPTDGEGSGTTTQMNGKGREGRECIIRAGTAQKYSRGV